TVNADGTVDVASGTAVGTYTIDYTICENLNPTNCDTTTITVVISDILDSDGDGVTDDQEILDGTDPNNPCAFNFESITEPQTGNYLVADCDGDGVTNGDEIADGTNPEDPCDYDRGNVTLVQTGDYLISDCDGDGVTNGTEITDATDPDDPCDYLAPSITLDRTGDYLDADCDGDLISNGREMTDGTNPEDPCSSLGGTPPTGVACDIIFENDLVGPDITDGVFKITNIESYPENTVRIYNRWGVLVFETQGYNNGSNGFRGISNGRVTIQKNEELPVGIYYYVVDYINQGEAKKKAGYLYVNR
ncbi:MAG: gliding motility-associated C-terminal domain-containing protein, partial [Maribacter sp.]|uniref:gliding motility-associated C-terminal domain-containing protein n=1 Tax=Maribacter sp. TaxID=1897614 RepID=UPI003C76E6EC